MLSKLSKKFNLSDIVDQVKNLGNFKRVELNYPSGNFFTDKWIIKPEFINTPIGNVLEHFNDIGQARLLCLESGESYTAHTDPDDRIHLAITTNEYSFLVDINDSVLYHLPADGEVWYMDTSKTHVATNWGPTSRIHLNIRVLLPKFDPTKKGIHLKIENGDFSWKQDSYIELMGFINKQIKAKSITGFYSPSERELYLNCEQLEIFEPVIRNIRNRNVDIVTKEI